MENNTKKFGLLIVDDEPNQREKYKDALSGESPYLKLKDIWSSIADCEDGESALKYIENYKNREKYHLLVIADAYMGPNCEKNKINNAGELFGGLWLIDMVNRNEELKKFVTILLTTFHDDKILYYRNKKERQFQWSEGEDYYFVEKPRVRNSIKDQIKATEALSKIKAPEEIKILFEKTFNAIENIIKHKENEESCAFRSVSMKTHCENKYNYNNEIIGISQGIRKSIHTSKLVAKSDAEVLLLGETGTGKEVFARLIHCESTRGDKTFVAVNCAAIPNALLESQMFGHKQGSFTGATYDRKGCFELAHNGTIFLDEIAEIPLDLQAKILRVLQEKQFERVGDDEVKEVDVRIITATNKDLQEWVSCGKFREDLFYRLNVVPITLPPLRERKEDIPLLVEHYLKEFNTENSKSCYIAPDVVELFLGYSWPGNVRQLKNILKRLVVLSEKTKIDVNDVKEMFDELKYPSKAKVIFKDLLNYAEFEKEYIYYILEKTKKNDGRWDYEKASMVGGDGMGEDTIRNRVKKYALSDPRFQKDTT